MGRIDEITGQITYVPIPPPFKPISFVVGPDKILYYINRSIAKIFRFSITKSKLLSPLTMPGKYDAMTMGPDQNLWLSDQFDNRIDVAVLRLMSTVPTSVTVGVTQTQTVTTSEKHAPKSGYTAASSNSSIATVAPGKAPDQFIVTGGSTGSCVVTISDAIGNSIPVAVTVQ
jgi:streptogramin lyase